MQLLAHLILNKFDNFIYRGALCSVPFILGFGIYPLLLGLIFIIPTIIRFGPRPFLCIINSPLSRTGFVIFLSLLSLFLLCYYKLYVPYHPEVLQMPWGYFGVLFFLSSLVVIWIAHLRTCDELLQFIWCMSLGAMLFGMLTVVSTALIGSPPFNSRVLDIRYIIFDAKRYINTPGIANLICLFPIVFMAGILLKSNQRPRYFWAIGIISLTLSLITAIPIAQRSYFAICFVITPIIVSFFLLLIGSWRAGLTMILLLGAYPILSIADKLLGTGFLYRPLNQGLLKDARFEMLEFWINHLGTSPFQRPEVGPEKLNYLVWFHNFFADIHRLSGFWALLAAVILVAYIFYRVVCVISKERRLGLFLMAVAIPNFLIMNTSVVPEGERQPFLLLLAIGAISEVILANKKLASSTKPHNDPLNSNPKIS